MYVGKAWKRLDMTNEQTDKGSKDVKFREEVRSSKFSYSVMPGIVRI